METICRLNAVFRYNNDSSQTYSAEFPRLTCDRCANPIMYRETSTWARMDLVSDGTSRKLTMMESICRWNPEHTRSALNSSSPSRYLTLQVSSPRDRLLHVDLRCGAGDKVHMLCEVPVLINTDPDQSRTRCRGDGRSFDMIVSCIHSRPRLSGQE